MSGKNKMKKSKLYIPHQKIVDFCRANRIRRLVLFGSVLREDFTPSSDVDVLVEFDADARVGMNRLAALEMELSQILGHKVDLNTPGFLSKYPPVSG
jgi:predicted nucleotidyltransferase